MGRRRLMPVALPQAVGLLPLRGVCRIEPCDRLLPRLMGGEMDGLKGQRANSLEQRSGRNEEYEQPTYAPKGQKN